MDKFNFIKCKLEDTDSVIELLKESELPFEDIDEHYDNYIAIKENMKVIGVVGLETYSGIGLLRSLAVDKLYRNRGLGKRLAYRIEAYAKSVYINELYLLTTTADNFFKKIGFEAVERAKLPDDIKNTKEFISICPVSAICMRKQFIR